MATASNSNIPWIPIIGIVFGMVTAAGTAGVFIVNNILDARVNSIDVVIAVQSNKRING